MGRIQQCVRDVLYIANKTEDFGQARKRIEATPLRLAAHAGVFQTPPPTPRR